MNTKKGSGKLLECRLVDVMTCKTLFEVMKDILGDIIIEFKQDPEMNNRDDSSETQKQQKKETKKEVKKEGEKDIRKELKKDDKNDTKNKLTKGTSKKPVYDSDENESENEDEDEIEEVEDDDDNEEIEEVEDDNEDEDAEEQEDDDEEEQEEQEEQEQDDKNSQQDDQKKKDSSGGIKIVAINYTRTLLILVKLDAREFTTFKVSKPIYDVGVNLLQLHKLIKSLDKDDILTISIDEEDTQMLVLDVENEVKNSRTRNRLKMLDINKKSYKIPATKFDVTITMDAVDFHKICKEMNQIAEYVEILCKENSITFTCKGDCSEKSTTLDATESNGIKIKFANPKKKMIVQGIFELKHFVMFSKCATLCPNIQIYMKNNYPIFTRYTVAKLGHVLLGLIPITDTNINNNFSDDEEDYSDDDKQVAMLK